MNKIIDLVLQIQHPLTAVSFVVVVVAIVLLKSARMKTSHFRTLAWLIVFLGSIALVSIVIVSELTEDSSTLPPPETTGQEQSFEIRDWWKRNNRGSLILKGELNSERYLTIWSQHFQRGRVIYNNVDGWVLIAYGEEGAFAKLKTSDVLITSGPGNSKVEREILDSYLENYSQLMKLGIEERIKKRELLGGIGTAFVRDNLYPKLGWPIGGEYLEREIILREHEDHYVFFGLQNRPGDEKTECVMSFDTSSGTYTKQTYLKEEEK